MSARVAAPAEQASAKLRKLIPEHAFKKSNAQATKTVLISLVATAATYALLSVLPWYLLPLGWILAGTAFTGLFTIGQDCGNGVFIDSQRVSDAIGTLCFLPILLPFESWKLHHSHREHTHKSVTRIFNPVLWVWDACVGVVKYYDISQFSSDLHDKALTSVYTSYLFDAVFIPLMVYSLGPWGLVKFWLVPWLCLHFWKNTYRNLGASTLRVGGDSAVTLTHYSFPAWVELLCHHSNFQIPTLPIPCYNLRTAFTAISQSDWGKSNVVNKFGLAVLAAPTSAETARETVERLQLQKMHTAEEANGNNIYLKRSLLGQINWVHTILLTSTPLIAIFGFCTTPVQLKTAAFAVVYYYFTGMGITAGYHRLFAHRAYDATWPVRVMLMLAGSGAVEGSIRWWARDHRVHHRYTDTPKDPYNARKGLLYSHMGWMLFKQNPDSLGRVDISDLNKDPMVRFQHRFYAPIALFMGFVLPTLVCGLGWGDWAGGYFFAGVARLVFVHHATFCVNSLAHYLGSYTFADYHTPKDHFITALVTLGEGYHNFHHEFPADYRNAIKFYQYDPTKWTIRMLAFFGLVHNLHRFPDNEIKKGKWQMKQYRLEREKVAINWGPDIQKLPLLSIEEMRAQMDESNTKLIAVSNLIFDVTEFLPTHPGGEKILQAYIGEDATRAFNGSVYNHSNAARNLLSTFVVARLKLGEHPPHERTDYEIDFKRPDTESWYYSQAPVNKKSS